MKRNAVFVCVHYVIIQKTKMGSQDFIHFQPKPFYKSYRKAQEARKNLIKSGKLSERNSTIEGFHLLTIHLN